MPYPRFLLDLRDDESEAIFNLRAPRLERAIGVIYRPETERLSHYFKARLADQFDAVLHFDQTRAVEPLERTAGWEVGEVEETFPTGCEFRRRSPKRLARGNNAAGSGGISLSGRDRRGKKRVTSKSPWQFSRFARNQSGFAPDNRAGAATDRRNRNVVPFDNAQ